MDRQTEGCQVIDKAHLLLIGLQVGEGLFDLTFQRLHEILFLSTFLLLFISVILLYECIIKETQHF
jgi:hypothetical protein